MRKLTKALLIAITTVSLGWSILSSLYTHTVSEKLAMLKRESHSDVIYLRCRLRELEKELGATILDRLTPSVKPVDGSLEEEEACTESDTASVAESEGDSIADTGDEAVTESVTLPTHEAPETRPSVDIEEPAGVYLLGVHEGRVALFDAAGALIDSVNVFVMTLPDADRAALEAGIPVSSPEEARELMERYE